MSSSRHKPTIWQAHALVKLCGIAAMTYHHGTPGFRYTGSRSVESDVETLTTLAEERKKVFSDYDVRSIRRRYKSGCLAILSDFQVSIGWAMTGGAIQEFATREAAAAWLA
jgi:hypothetical protein